jgi:hypothetical protein
MSQKPKPLTLLENARRERPVVAGVEKCCDQCHDTETRNAPTLSQLRYPRKGGATHRQRHAIADVRKAHTTTCPRTARKVKGEPNTRTDTDQRLN